MNLAPPRDENVRQLMRITCLPDKSGMFDREEFDKLFKSVLRQENYEAAKRASDAAQREIIKRQSEMDDFVRGMIETLKNAPS